MQAQKGIIYVLLAILMISNEFSAHISVAAISTAQTHQQQQQNNNYLDDKQTNEDQNTQAMQGKVLQSTEQSVNDQTKNNINTNTVSQETLDAAAQMATDEANKDLVGVSSDTVQSSSTQEANLLKSLNSLEDGSLESTLDSSMNLNSEQGQIKNAVDSTLEEIQRLHIMDKELAKVNLVDKAEQKNKIDQGLIEEETIHELQGDKDKHKVEQLVQQQIQDQVDAMEATQSLQSSMDILEYGAQIDGKDFTAIAEEEQKALLEKQLLQEANDQKEKEFSHHEQAPIPEEIDNTNVLHLQSQAALDDVSISQIHRSLQEAVSKEPMMPSADSSAIDLGDDFSFSYKRKPKPKTEKQQIEDVVKNTLLQSKGGKSRELEAQALFQAKLSHDRLKTKFKAHMEQQKLQGLHEQANKVKSSASAVKKQNEKMSSNKKQKLSKKHKKHKKKHHHKTLDEQDHEMSQLDNLFLTIREELVSKDDAPNSKPNTNATASTNLSQHKKKKERKKKINKDKKQSTQLVQIKSDLNLQTVSDLKPMKQGAPKEQALNQILEELTAKENLMNRLDQKLSTRLNGFQRKDTLRSIEVADDLKIEHPPQGLSTSSQQKEFSDQVTDKKEGLMTRVGEKIADWQKNGTNFKGGHLVYKSDPSYNQSSNNSDNTTSLHQVNFNDTVIDKQRGSIKREGIKGLGKFKNETTYRGAPLSYRIDPSWRNASENATVKAKANANKNKTGAKNSTAGATNSTGSAKNNSRPSNSSLLQLNAEINLSQLSQDKLNSQNRLRSRQKVGSKQKDIEDVTDLSCDEYAEMELKKMAHQQIRTSQKELNAGQEQQNDNASDNTDNIKVADNLALLDADLFPTSSYSDSKNVNTDVPDLDNVDLHNNMLRKYIGEAEIEGVILGQEKSETDAVLAQQLSNENELNEAAGLSSLLGDTGPTDEVEDKSIKQELDRIQIEQAIKKTEASAELFSELTDAPSSSVLLQLGSSSQSEALSQVEAQTQAHVEQMVQLRSQAATQAQAAAEALAALGVQQKSQIKSQDANLIDALKRTIGQLEAKQNPAIAAAQAKKKAVNNIQKALTKKILTRLDDSQPLINVFSKMQSLSKMMPAVQDFERRLGILHQVEPILENAINTLSKVVDLNAAVPGLPTAAPAPKPAPPPPPAAPQPDINQLKALLAQAQLGQAPAPAPEPEPALDDLLGGGGLGGLGGLLGGLGGAAAPVAPEVPSLGGLEGLLGGAAEPAPATMEAPAFLQVAAQQQQAAAAAATDPLAALGGAATGLSGTDESALISRLLGSRLLQLDADINMGDELSSESLE